MAMSKVFKLNKDGKVEFTTEELKKLLDEVYNKGYEEGKNENWSWTSPYHWPSWVYTGDSITTTNANSNTLTIDSSGLKSPYYIDSTNDTSITLNCK